MDTVLLPTSKGTCGKTLFKLKPQRDDGRLLNVRPKVSSSAKNVRFIMATFHPSNNILALVDNNENVFIIDCEMSKFWELPSQSCTSIQFSTYNTDEIFFGLVNKEIQIMDFQNGCVSESLKGHRAFVKNMTFAQQTQQQHLLLSSSEEEAILWDLRTNTMLHVLDLENSSALKYACFIPMSCNILVCFHDDVIQIWNAFDFEKTKIFSPKNWKNYSVKCIAFSKNGQVMVVAGYVPILAVFFVNNWSLYKFVNLAEYVQNVRYVEFVPHPFDAGFNKILAILSYQGIVHFYNFDTDTVVSELKTTSEIRGFTICSKGKSIVCLLHCGDTSLYDLEQYAIKYTYTKPQRGETKTRHLLKTKTKDLNVIKCKLDAILDRGKLKEILEEYGEFPEVHRLKIWEHLLEIPYNYKAYNSVINHVTTEAYDDLSLRYPLENTLSIICLKKLLGNLVAWCQFFANVDYLPLFVFPFVKTFRNKPIACFESICTILMNWCQHWFEYCPLAPFNILACVENILYEHDPELLNFFVCFNVASVNYVWPLLASAFSEVLSCSEWLVFWDHVLINEISFLLCAAAAYNVVQRVKIMKMKTLQELKVFYQNQNPVDFKRLLGTTYYLMNNLSEKIHPRQYLKDFQGIGKGSYPIFDGYPAVVFEKNHVSDFEEDFNKSLKHENEIFLRKRKEEGRKIRADLRVHEHQKRIREMEHVLLDRIKSKENLLKMMSTKLTSMKNSVRSTESGTTEKK